MPEQKVAKRDEITAIIQVIERAALNPDVDIDKMERLLQMQERILDRQGQQAFAAAMVRAQRNMPKIGKTEFNPQTQSRYADLGKIIEKISPIYTAEGLSLSFSEGDSPREGFVRVICDIFHDSGHSVQRHLDMPVVTTGIKGNTMMTDTHATGSAFTYGRRYLTLLIFNIATGDDVDGNTYERIDGKQVAEIEKLLEQIDRDAFMGWLNKKGVAAIADIPAKDFKGVMNLINKKVKANGNS